jgi:hypothetical protein
MRNGIGCRCIVWNCSVAASSHALRTSWPQDGCGANGAFFEIFWIVEVRHGLGSY